MDDAFGLFLPVPQFVLLAAAEVDLVVGELAAGERLAVGGGRLQVSGLTYAAPQAVAGVGRNLLAERLRVEFGIEQALKIIQVILTVVAVAQQVLHQRYARGGMVPPVAPGVARPVEDV